MLDRDLVLAKAGSIKRRLKRIHEKGQTDLRTFLNDLDLQEVVLFNLQMAIQDCIDIAAYIISEEGLGVPGSTNEMLYLLQENGYLDRDVTEKMVQAVGFRNLLVHEYAALDMERVYDIAHQGPQDLKEYLRKIVTTLALAP